MYKETRIIQASEIGYNNKIRITDLIDMIQDVEGAHIESLSALAKENKAPHRLNSEVLKTLGHKKKFEMTYEGRKISLNRTLAFVKEESGLVKPSYLDYYQHMNNAVYVDLAY